MRLSLGKGNVFLPFDEDAREQMSKLEVGAIVNAEHDRHAAFERLVFATIARYARAKGTDVDHMELRLQEQVGDYKFIPINGALRRVFKSMSRRSTSAKELRAFWDGITQIIQRDLHNLPAPDAEELGNMIRGDRS